MENKASFIYINQKVVYTFSDLRNNFTGHSERLQNSADYNGFRGGHNLLKLLSRISAVLSGLSGHRCPA